MPTLINNGVFSKKQFRCRITHLNCLLLKEINIFYFYFALAFMLISHRIFRIHVYSHFAIILYFAYYFVPRRWAGLTMISNHLPDYTPYFIGATGDF